MTSMSPNLDKAVKSYDYKNISPFFKKTTAEETDVLSNLKCKTRSSFKKILIKANTFTFYMRHF